ncbi:MAG: 16S rRNA (uracil(1498)-N(3))-methyltransferase [Streptosporangiales bacterium]|nr:16S rRNA (uracil(1498)-N(3))-methyltransferase [Streptosporangiales bacterium]
MSTPPLFHVATDRLDAAVVTLDGGEGRHAARVRRIRAGERVYLSDGAGRRALCEVTGVAVDALTCSVLERCDVSRPEPWLVVVQALLKGDGAERAVETMTEAGVDEIVPWQADRSIVRWRADRAEKSARRWRETATQAAKQARRAWTPAVADAAGLADVTARVRAAAAAYVLERAGGRSASTLDPPASGDVVVVVGPEGGIAPTELAELTGAGAEPLRLGPTVLRSATAGTVAAAVLLARTPRWR